MQYKGKELVEFTSDKYVAFNPPKKMFVWDCEGYVYKRRVVAYLGGYHRDYKVLAFGPIDECKTLESYAHCAEIPKGKTNWEVYQERYGATMKSLDEALEVFNAYTVVPCQFCPARGHCASDVRSKTCRATFKEWAETEAKDETAGNV